MMSKKRRVPVLISPLVALLLLWLGYKMLPVLQYAPVKNTVGNKLMAVAAPQSGSANAVTAVVVWFRGLDTLGEVTVLFLAATGVGMLLGHGGGVKRTSTQVAQAQLSAQAPQELTSRPHQSSPILNTAAQWLFPLLLVFGVYIITHGHLSPGGGFQGGVVIASAVILLLLAGVAVPSLAFFHKAEGSAGAVYVLLALGGLALGLGFLGDWVTALWGGGHGTLNQGDTNVLFSLFSAGIIPLLYGAIGVKVGVELSALGKYLTGEENH
jgi:multicomponent Na+:H+ antiporter subunit B